MAAAGELFERSGNVYRAQTLVNQLVTGVSKGSRFVFSEALLKQLHATITDGQIDNNGAYRRINVSMQGATHVPPNFLEVPAHMGTLVGYVQDNWDSKDMVHLAAFVLWRLLWVHPFEDGNGRTSRAACYLVLCAKHGNLLPGSNTVMTQMMNARFDYCNVLRECDLIYRQTNDIGAAVEPMARMISAMLIVQLT